ncbi:MAG: nucleoside phosphorylase [Ardenticatenaceae bacterium]|nr:nucleoside phosphorylase [Ardenticatenaceae bacterium]MCB9445443.1 nucleoside phosphorylase [Ardenticatenaceae bacterium]
MAEKLLPHIGLAKGSVSADVLVCGDPARATRIAERLDEAVLLGEKREYRTFQGRFADKTITVTSHGIGAPGAAIAFEELIAAGAQRIVRVGTCGGLQPDMRSGDLVVATAAVDFTGYGRSAVPKGYPAVADPELALALRAAVKEHGRSPRSGIVFTSDIFYEGVYPALPLYHTMSQANVQAVEMECAALFIIGSLRSVQTGAILVVDGNVLGEAETMDTFDPDQTVVKTAVDDATLITLRALAKS